jgi:murein DD-endopeptidase MepM/ murein hydrolase activator NlpD
LVALFFIVSASSIKASNPITDSLVASIKLNVPAEKQRTAIQSMNKKQLVMLVDYLFAQEKIPLDLINEINLAVDNLKDDESDLAPYKHSPNAAFPAADFYVSWEIDKLFPEEDMLNMQGDTSVTLNLKYNGHSNYFHPFNGPVTSGFGWRDTREHKGIDIDLDKGDKVSAAFDGMVRVARMYGGFGNVVIIRHYNGLETVYAHLSKIKVEPGQLISAGDVIGLGGNTGHSRGTHLHFEVRFKGIPLNPKFLISLTDQSLICDELTIKQTKWGLAAFPKDAKVYTVEKGDTIWGIAKHFGTTTNSIKKLNDFSGDKIRLQAGQLINVAQ